MAKKAMTSVPKRLSRKKSAPEGKAAEKTKKPLAKVAPVRAGKPIMRKTSEHRADEPILGPKAWSKQELNHFKEIILAKRRETLEELDTLKESMMDVTTGEYISESSNYSLHMEQGTDAMEREKTFLLASRSSKFVNQLDDALTRIDAGTFGVCRVCQLLVPKERLEAVPTAQTCAEYKNTSHPCERGKLALARKRQSK